VYDKDLLVANVLKHFETNKFECNAGIGMTDIHTKYTNHDNKRKKLIIFDQSLFDNINTNINGFFKLFDVTSRDDFNKVHYWIQIIKVFLFCFYNSNVYLFAINYIFQY
jgi:hypothetical protein